MSATQEVAELHSGAAGAAKFAGSDSRRYNYFEPKGRKATHYEDMTVDVQPDPKRYLLQDWIISFADGTPTYYEGWTKAKSSNWHIFRAVDQEWERTHYQRQSTIVGMLKNVIDNGRRSGAPKRFDRAWVKILQDHVGAFKHAEFGLGTSTMQAQRYGYTQMINNAILTNSSYKLRFAQDLTLYLSELALDIDLDLDAGKAHWLEDPIWQGTRRSIESIMGATDYLEQYFATNVIFEPLIGELFRSGFVMQDAAAQNDFITPSVVSAAEGDYERNLANAVELFSILVQDPEFGEQNRKLFVSWADAHGQLAKLAAANLQPIWSQPRVKAAQYADSFDAARNRMRAIAAEIGFDARAIIDG
jgi:propane monooxygenase small subunit